MKLVIFSILILFGLQFHQISAKSEAVRKAQYEELIELYDPSARIAAAQTYQPSVADPDDGYSQPQYSSQSVQRGQGGSRSRAPKYQSDEEAKRAAEEEEEKKPDRLALLLQDSKFTCDEKKDGYYADETVACQVFHYCVAGAKHSWQCPENTVFHQIHLNCVPAAQDICTQSSKFHVVNDYLYKELDQRGPNNSVRYAQRFYPEGFDFGGDVLSQVLPQSQPQRPAAQPYNSYRDSDDDYAPRGNSRSQNDNYPSYQSYPAPAPAPVRSQPAPRPAARPIYKPQPVRTTTTQAYSAPTYTTQPQPKPTSRPFTYSTPSQYSSSSYADSDDSDSYDSYPSSNTGYSGSSSGSSRYSPSSSASSGYSPSSSGSSGYSPSSSYSSPSTYSAPSSSYSAPTSSYSSSSYGALSSSSYPSSGSSSLGSSSALSSYRPVQAVKPASYPNRGIGIPIASFRVANSASPSYGSSAAASRVQSAAHPSNPSTFSLGAFSSEMASGVKYDEDY